MKTLRNVAMVLFFLIAILIIAVCCMYNYQLKPVDSKNSDEIKVVIPSGSSVKKIGEILEKEELISALEANDYNLTKVGKIYNVTANAIKKWCKHYEIVKDNFFHTKKIQQYDLNNNFIQEFNSITEAMNETNITTIKKCLQGKSQSAGSFIWRYANEENNS
jgi:hypothetical protein